MNRFAYSFCSVIILFIVSCEHDKLTLPHIDTEDQNTTSSNEAEYVQLNRVFDAASGYNFNHPADIYYGVDNFIYIADTDNDRIVMLDLGGTIQGYSQTIPHPEAISQNGGNANKYIKNWTALTRFTTFLKTVNTSRYPMAAVLII